MQTLTDTYTPSTDIQSCRLRFVATATDSELYVDSVTIVETNSDYAGILQERGGVDEDALVSTTLVFAPHQNMTTETNVG